MSAVDEPIISGLPPRATRVQAKAYLLSAPGRAVPAVEVGQIVDALWLDGGRLGIRPDVAAAQVAHETGMLTFTGQVRAEQRNPAGIGATNDGAAGLTFPNWREGIRAYFVHPVA